MCCSPHPPPGHLACCCHLLVTLLLRYRLRNQSGLTCKHMAIQIQRRQVVAWKQNPRGGTTGSRLTVTECPFGGHSTWEHFPGERVGERQCAQSWFRLRLLALCSQHHTTCDTPDAPTGNLGRRQHQGPGGGAGSSLPFPPNHSPTAAHSGGASLQLRAALVSQSLSSSSPCY